MIEKTKENPAAGPYASYMRLWLMMKISAQNAPSLFGKRRLVREWLKYAEEFGLDRFPTASDAEKEQLINDWKGFLNDFCHLCLTDRTYGSTLFGLVPMKSDTVEEKLLNEIRTVTFFFPERLGLEETFAPLAGVAEEIYHNSISD